MRMTVFAALRWECQPVLRALRRVSRSRVEGITVWRGESGAGDVQVIQTGMGMERATKAAQLITDADVVLSTGCAGALDPTMRPGDIVIATEVVSAVPGHRLPTHPRLRHHIEQVASRRTGRSFVGPVLCSHSILATADAKHQAAEATGAIAVEMEGAPLAERAAALRVSFASIRSILDTSDTDVTDTAPFLDPATGGVRPFALAVHLAGHPRTFKALLSMQPQMAAARASLERFFVALLAEPPPFDTKMDR